jgi:signal transduction histidine kinase
MMRKIRSKLFPSMSLRSRVVLMVFALLIAGIWGLAARVAAVAQADLGNALMQSMSATVYYVATDLDSDIQLRIEVLNAIAASIAPEVVGDPATILQILQQREVSAALFPLGLIVTNKDGIYIAEYPSVSGRLGASIRDTDFFRQIMAGAKQAVSTQVIGRTAKQPLYRVGVPLRDASGAAAGVLFGALIASDLQLFGNLEQTKIGKNGFISVLSPKDHLIVSSTDPDRIMQRLPAKGVNPLLDRRLEEGFEGPGVITNLYGLEVLSVGRHMDTTGWIVVAAAPTAEIFAPIAALKRHIYLAALLISLAVAAILGLVLARQLAPLKKAAEAMRRMTEGEEPLAPIAVARKDEIGELIGSFNQLAAERIRLDAALRGEVGAHKQAEEALDQALTRLQALSERMTRAQEEQRRKTAFELHEQSGQELSTLMIHLQLLEAHCRSPEAQAHLQNARTIARLALERVRTMSLDLHPPQLEALGLYVALHGHCRQQAQVAGWIMHFDAPETGERPHRDVEITCFRVVQEALANVAEHAKATEVWVSLRRSDDKLQLRVRDNGLGFDAGGSGGGMGYAGLGLTAMAERVRQVAGRMDIRSNPGSGTEIEVRFFF